MCNQKNGMSLIYYRISIVLIGLIITTLFYVGVSEQSKMEKGQIWETTYYVSNPFEETIKEKKMIIDIKSQHILYVNESNDTLSEKINRFTILSKCVENCN